MYRFLIVQADSRGGRGVRGLNLARFLRIYHGRKAVRLIQSHELLRSRPISTETLFIGMPSTIGKQHLKNLQFRQAVLFDYEDSPGPTWMQSDRDLLLSLTTSYLKPWVEPDWDDGLTMGVLPIRRHQKLKLYLQCRELLAPLRAHRYHERPYDVAFVGNATAPGETNNQRIEWLREIRHAQRGYSFWGGIVMRKNMVRRLQAQHDDLNDLTWGRGRVNFLTYFANLQRSRVALAPSGNARWSYRHYEAIYAGANLVSTDFRKARLLIPLPVKNIEHVPDHTSVLPAVDRALDACHTNPDRADENIQFLEQFLAYGDYCRQKPQLMDRFLDQLPDAA